jgi:methylisocitrate lyase
MQIEDQELPKKCGHLPGKRLVSTEEMAGKLRAACDARRNPDFVIIARTDARAIEGLEGAVTRACAYVEAGADAVFPEALESKEEFRRFAEGLSCGGKVPLIANMTEFGRTPYLSVAEFEALGYRLVLFPVSALRVATKAVDALLQALKNEGSQRGSLQDMHTRRQLYELLQYEEYERRERAYRPKHDDSDDR